MAGHPVSRSGEEESAVLASDMSLPGGRPYVLPARYSTVTDGRSYWTSWLTTSAIDHSAQRRCPVCLNEYVYHIISYHIVDLKRQNRLKVGTNKPKLKDAVSIRWWCPEKTSWTDTFCFELAAKGVFRLGRCYIFWQSIPGLRASNCESTATDFVL